MKCLKSRCAVEGSNLPRAFGPRAIHLAARIRNQRAIREEKNVSDRPERHRLPPLHPPRLLSLPRRGARPGLQIAVRRPSLPRNTVATSSPRGAPAPNRVNPLEPQEHRSGLRGKRRRFPPVLWVGGLGGEEVKLEIRVVWGVGGYGRSSDEA